MRLGLDITGNSVRLSVVDGEQVVHLGEVSLGDRFRDTLGRARRSLPASLRSRISEVRISAVPSLSDLRLSSVGHIRIAPKTMPTLHAFASWPADLYAQMEGRTAEVLGGSDFVGKEHRMPTERDLLAARERLLERGATSLVVTAAGAPSAPWIEGESARILSRESSVPVALAHSVGGTGLRERENAAVLNAALVPWAHRVATEAEAIFADVRIGFSHGLGGYCSSAEFRKHPLGTLHGRMRAAALGASLIWETSDLLLALVEGTRARVIGVTNGRLDAADVETVWGVPHNHLALEAVEVPQGAVSALGESRSLSALKARRPGHVLAAVGDVDPGQTKNKMVSEAASFAVAIGATLGSVTIALERVIPATRGAADEGAAAAEALVEEATTKAILAGASPHHLDAPEIDVRPLAYVVDPARTVRVRLSGRPN